MTGGGLSNFQKVVEFHNAFGHPAPGEYAEPSPQLVELRVRLIKEEQRELIDELVADQIEKEKVAKEIADLLYVTYGLAAAIGLDIDRVFSEVHRSNMSKLGDDGKPVLREDGKVLKGPNYSPADLSFL